ncbi:hypothetical protein DMN77_19650 [Paenibacillus sp. 79R4]|uniref:hypothetical protein n=1 Tax=Paenibacillus sp. 79R4 TaxID=2212847 RepID=UPI0015BF85AE|nr:hypothetical protein [Paenibacillus sp. 79R4]NWL89767.1 hypothetical protein [Paenibacillus sp. 79R4]
MKVKDARAAAVHWVTSRASQEAGYMGAYFSGSTIELPEEEELPAASDIDVMVVLDRKDLPLKPGKRIHYGALIEITYISWPQLSSAKNVLTSYHLASGLRTDTILDDPTGDLRAVQREVSRHFAERAWVRRRCENVLQSIEMGLGSINPSAPWHDLVTSWLFPTGITTHLLLVAALRNPTVRKRYLATKQVLQAYRRADDYQHLLKLLGCENLSPQRVEMHLNELAGTFDAASAVASTPFFFSSDITAAARPIVIDGSRELIRSGYHREAVFWMMATFARCHKILAADAPELHALYTPSFHDMAADLGIRSWEDIQQRAKAVSDFLPYLREVAEDILLANPEIE